VDLDDGKPMKLEIDGRDKNDVDLDIDGIQFQIPVKHKEPGVLDFLPDDLKKEEIENDGGVDNAIDILSKTSSSLLFCLRIDGLSDILPRQCFHY
jgi:hypothetical protein